MSQQKVGAIAKKTASIIRVYISPLVAAVTGISLPVLIVAATVPADAPTADLTTVPAEWYALYAIMTAGSYSYLLRMQLVDNVSGLLREGVSGIGGEKTQSDGDG